MCSSELLLRILSPRAYSSNLCLINIAVASQIVKFKILLYGTLIPRLSLFISNECRLLSIKLIFYLLSLKLLMKIPRSISETWFIRPTVKNVSKLSKSTCFISLDRLSQLTGFASFLIKLSEAWGLSCRSSSASCSLRTSREDSFGNALWCLWRIFNKFLLQRCFVSLVNFWADSRNLWNE